MDPSVEYYPQPYCDILDSKWLSLILTHNIKTQLTIKINLLWDLAGMPTACYEFSIFELWARRGKFDEFVDEEIENLTRDKILDRINNHNTRQEDLHK